jgi:oligopeptide transport system substrate-binding protein
LRILLLAKYQVLVPFLRNQKSNYSLSVLSGIGNYFVMVFFSLLIFSCGETSSVDDASREGILIMGNSGEPKGLDPHIVSGVLESNVIRSLFEGLVEAHPSKDGIAMPGVAEKWYPVNPKRPDEWVFELRKDAQWSDGEELTGK